MILQRLQSSRRDRFADMRMVEDDEIVARAQVGDRMRLEPFERLLVPAEFAIGPGRRPRGNGVIAARMIPGQAARAPSFCFTTPPAISRSISSHATPAYARISRLRSPSSRAPPHTAAAALE